MSSSEATRAGLDPRAVIRSIRWMQAGLGLSCFGLGAVGTVVPGMPTTVFLLMGSYLLTRSCPVLERRLRESRLFQPYALYLDDSKPFPLRARHTALTAMWVSIVVSGTVLAWRGAGPVLLGTLVVAGFVGTVAIRRFRRHLDPPA